MRRLTIVIVAVLAAIAISAPPPDYAEVVPETEFDERFQAGLYTGHSGLAGRNRPEWDSLTQQEAPPKKGTTISPAPPNNITADQKAARKAALERQIAAEKDAVKNGKFSHSPLKKQKKIVRYWNRKVKKERNHLKAARNNAVAMGKEIKVLTTTLAKNSKQIAQFNQTMQKTLEGTTVYDSAEKNLTKAMKFQKVKSKELKGAQAVAKRGQKSIPDIQAKLKKARDHQFVEGKKYNSTEAARRAIKKEISVAKKHFKLTVNKADKKLSGDELADKKLSIAVTVQKKKYTQAQAAVAKLKQKVQQDEAADQVRMKNARMAMEKAKTKMEEAQSAENKQWKRVSEDKGRQYATQRTFARVAAHVSKQFKTFKKNHTKPSPGKSKAKTSSANKKKGGAAMVITGVGLHPLWFVKKHQG